MGNRSAVDSIGNNPGKHRERAWDVEEEEIPSLASGDRDIEEFEEEAEELEREETLFSVDYTELEEINSTITPSRINEERFIDLAVLEELEGSNKEEIVDKACSSYGRSESSVRSTLDRFAGDGLIEDSNTLSEKGEVAVDVTKDLVLLQMDEIDSPKERIYSAVMDSLGLEPGEDSRDLIEPVINDDEISGELEEKSNREAERESAHEASKILSGFKNGKSYAFEVFSEHNSLTTQEVTDIINQSEADYVPGIKKSTLASQVADWKKQGLLEGTSEGIVTTEKGDLVYSIIKRNASKLNESEHRLQSRKNQLSRKDEIYGFQEEARNLDEALELVQEASRLLDQDIDQKINLEDYSPMAKYLSKHLEYEPQTEL